MKNKKIKVFHGVINYGTQAGMLAKELRNQGVEARSVSMPDRFKRLIDVELAHGGNVFQKIYRHTWNWLRRVYWFFRYNTFHFYYGKTLLPRHVDLPFYRLFGKKVIFHYLGKDVKLYKESIERYEISNMAYSSPPHEEALAKDAKIKKRLKLETKYADKQIVCSPVYSEFVPGAMFLPLAIDLTGYEYRPKPIGDPVVIMHAPTSRSNKGTEFILQAIERLKGEGVSIDFMLCENISHAELKRHYYECDLFIDQVLGGYGTAAIEAMAIGRPTISYLRDVHFNESSFPEGLPIIRAHKDNVYEVLRETLKQKEAFPRIGEESRMFVEKYHDVEVIAARLQKIYTNLHAKNRKFA